MNGYVNFDEVGRSLNASRTIIRVYVVEFIFLTGIFEIFVRKVNKIVFKIKY